MNLKLWGTVGFVVVLLLASAGIYALINLGDRGIQQIETCDIDCTSEVTNDRFQDLRQDLRSEYPAYNLSRVGKRVHCPCSNSTTLTYDIRLAGMEAGLLTYENGETDITVTLTPEDLRRSAP